MRITTSSTRKQKELQFRKISATRYITDHGFSVIFTDGYFHITKNSLLAKWSPRFLSVSAASRFLNSHNYLSATEDHIDISADDIAYVLEFYDFEPQGGDIWLTHSNGYDIFLNVSDPQNLALSEEKGESVKTQEFNSIQDLLIELDSYFKTEKDDTNRSIFAASNSRDISQNLVRVKSSNVWAYGMNIKDGKAKTGDVYIQFKGRKGGPGDVYVYYDVPANVWRKFLSASSKGHFFWMFIRDNFKYSKLTGDRRGKLRNAIN